VHIKQDTESKSLASFEIVLRSAQHSMKPVAHLRLSHKSALERVKTTVAEATKQIQVLVYCMTSGVFVTHLDTYIATHLDILIK